MSYYLLPTKNKHIDIFLTVSDTISTEPYISPSLLYYLQSMNEQLNTIISENTYGYTVDFLQKIINPYQYIFTKVSGSKNSVSKMKHQSDDFYIFLEIIQTLNLFDVFSNKKINTIVQGKNYKTITDCIDFIHETYENNHSTEFSKQDVDFIYFETHDTIENYSILCLKKILEFQSKNGVAIIKLNSITSKLILDVLFILTSLYDKIYIIKPNSSNMCNGDRFIVAKKFTGSIETSNYYLSEINTILTNKHDKIISSIVKQDLPSHFLTKVEEANIIIGHQQLEVIEQMVNLAKNKNKEDKIECFKKNNIQKCIQWCEKYKIPHHKFIEKMNIFLNAVVEDTVVEDTIEE